MEDTDTDTDMNTDTNYEKTISGEICREFYKLPNEYLYGSHLDTKLDLDTIDDLELNISGFTFELFQYLLLLYHIYFIIIYIIN